MKNENEDNSQIDESLTLDDDYYYYYYGNYISDEDYRKTIRRLNVAVAILLILSIISIVFYFTYEPPYMKGEGLLVGDIEVLEKSVPESTHTFFNQFKHADEVDLYYADFPKPDVFSVVHGAYLTELYDGKAKIYLAERQDEGELHSTLIHEYSHHLMNIYSDETPYLETFDKIESEENTDVLAYYIGKAIGVKFKPSYKSEWSIRNNDDDRLQADIDTILTLEGYK